MPQRSLRNILKTSATLSCAMMMLPFAAAQAQDIGTLIEGEFLDLGTISVARRREEELIEVPISAVAVDEEELQDFRLHDLEDLARSVPGYEQPSYGDDPRTAQPIIRGVGTLSTLLAPDNATSPVVLDGVPLPTFAASGQLLDIGQVEVLRGPQGTLFGRNSTGGAVVINSREADGAPEQRFNLELGTDGYGLVEYTISKTLGEYLSGRLSVRGLTQDGYIQNDLPGQADLGGMTVGALKGTLNWLPNGQTEVKLTFNVEKDDRDTGYPILLRDSPAYQETPEFSRDMENVALNIRHELERYTLHSVTGITHYDIYNRTDNSDGYVFSSAFGLPVSMFTDDGEFNETDQHETQLYQELRLQSLEGAPISWVLGAVILHSHYSEDATGTSNFFPTVNGTRRVELETASQAIFGDIVIPFAERFEFGAGLRYTHEKKSIDSRFVGNGFAGTVATFAQTSEREFDMVTGRLSLSYAPTDGSLIYGSISRGAKAGGYPRFTNNASYGRAETGYDESTSWSYEIGYKSAILGGSGYVTTSAFYNDIAGEAIFGYDPATNTFPIENMDTKSYGIEAETRFDLTNGFDIGLGAAWTKSEITGVQAGSQFPAAVGKPVPNVPEFTGVISVGYEDYADFVGLSDAIFRGLVTYRYVGSRSVDPTNSYDLDEMDIVDARLSLTKGNTEFYIFGENLLDKQLEQQGSQIAPGTNSVTVSRGRTVGLGLTVNF